MPGGPPSLPLSMEYMFPVLPQNLTRSDGERTMVWILSHHKIAARLERCGDYEELLERSAYPCPGKLTQGFVHWPASPTNATASD
jgi:hypothetical protein